LRPTIQRRTTGPRSTATESGLEPSVGSDSERASATTQPSSQAVALPVLRVVDKREAADGATDEGDGSPRDDSGGSAGASTSSPTVSSLGRSTRATSAASTVHAHTAVGATGADPLVVTSAHPQRRPLAGSQPIGQLGPLQRQAIHSTDGSATGGGSSMPSGTPATFGGSPLDAPAAGGSAHLASSAARLLPAAPLGEPAAILARASGQRQAAGTPALMKLARPAPPAAVSPAAAASPTVARSIISDIPGPVQTTPIAAPAIAAPVLAPTATPIIQRIDGSSAAPPPPTESEGHSEDELDELARALFGRFRSRLRSEYIHEREAKGLIFDNA
jgi:hypothetical protein